MNFFLKPKLSRISLVLIIANLVSFLVFYIPNYVMKSEPYALTCFRLFFGEFIAFILISLAVTFMYHEYIAGKSLWRMLLSGVALIATNCIYNLPYYYLLETALGNDWIESTLSSLMINLLIITIDLLKLLLFTLITVKASMLFAKKRSREEHSATILSSDGARILALEAPEQKAFFITALCIFVYNVIFEIVDVINHLAQYGSFRSSELIFVVFKFIFLIILLIISYVLQILLYNYYRKAYKNDQGI